jgi:hypothetical protein
MTTDASAVHRVTVEFIVKRAPVIREFESEQEARRCVETAKRDPDAWHIFHSFQKTPRGQQRIEMSLYRSHETRDWRDIAPSPPPDPERERARS